MRYEIMTNDKGCHVYGFYGSDEIKVFYLGYYESVKKAIQGIKKDNRVIKDKDIKVTAWKNISMW